MSITLPRLAVAGACILLGACASPVTDPGPVPVPAPVPVAFPVDPAERNGQAVLHAQRGEVRQAIAIWEALLAGGALREPRHAYLLRNLGHAYRLAGRDADAVTVLEKACLLDPRNALAWQQLAQVLARLGQHERAARMQDQAHSLQAREVPRVRAEAEAMPVPAPVAPVMDRIDITQSAGMAVLQRVAAASPPDAPRLRLEILNGNGKPGMAAALARSLAGSDLQVVRTANASSFRVARTRVEYRPAQRQAARQLARQLGGNIEFAAADCPASELRLILGRDIDPAVLHRYYVQQLELARQALARLG
ncbi:LytR C-terminal domain-containing protein [Janthinobacterium sp. J1-1]|uniref:LytR C-terminal domain-containing protein n=1 Tax=Janthinobacterium sp. J1-1 TaxID=3065910 RepID=UPI0028110A13|nr:LytR C-terminal domain-containing protein [Janthinobacterium sp. J1-1]